MKLEITFLRSKVARRLFALFVIVALVPMVLLALLAQTTVSDTLREIGQQQLRDQAKAYGAGLYGRLGELDQRLQQLAERARRGESGNLATDSVLTAAFANISLIRGDRREALLGVATPFPILDARARAHIEGGGTLAVLNGGADGSTMIVMLRALDRNPGSLLVAVPKTAFLFGDADSLPSNTDVCVFTGELTLHCTRPISSNSVPSSPDGDVRFVHQQAAWQAAEWRLFLDARFLASEWRVVAARSLASVLAPARDFQQMFRLTAALAMVMIIFLTIRQVRRQLVPLEKLTEATDHVGQSDFTPVKITSDDEFERLGNAFNRMALRLGRQFAALKANAELDRRILADAGVDSVVEAALEQMTRILPADVVSIAILSNDRDAQSYHFEKGARAMHRAGQIRISDAEIGMLAGQRNGVVLGRRAAEPAFVLPLKVLGANCVAAFPVLLDDRVAGILTFGFARSVELSADDHAHARDLADRIGVALANADRSDQIYRQARFDALTGLNNRWYFRDRLAEACAAAERAREPIAVLYLNLVRFKQVNDAVGQVAGDHLLQEVGARLRLHSRAADLLARLGGDEFAIALTGRQAAREVRAVADKLIAALALPFNVGGREHFIGARVGVTLYPTDATEADTLMRNADIALERARAASGTRFAFFESQMNAEMAERVALEQDLHRALERDELTLHYQPQHDVRTGKMSGVEVLVRWQHPTRGLVPPNNFIPMAEECGLIDALGEWVLRRACTQYRVWCEARVAPPTIAVNVSTRQLLEANFAERIAAIVRDTDVAPQCLELEITEGLLMQDAPQVAANLQRLRVLGVRFALDDFGTGFSSLAYLKRLPIDVLKIDRFFIRDIATNADAQAIVNGILAMAGALDKQVVAEGVETEEQMIFLRAQNCHLMQGYYFNRPMPAEELTAILRRDSSNDPRVIRFVPRA